MQAMKTFKIISLGCKVNQYESQQIRELLESFGLRQAEEKQSPDIAVIHTCCVTQAAASKSRQAIRKILNSNSSCKIIATGCLTSIDGNETANIPKEVMLVARENALTKAIQSALGNIANNAKNTQHSVTSKTANETKIKDKKEAPLSNDPLGLASLNSYKNQSRAFLKIQDGCDAFCTYCIIPKTRKLMWSNPAENVLDEAKRLVDAGHKEIVLTGIFLGAYGQVTTKRKQWNPERQKEFIKLIEMVAQIDGLKRLRLSSMEPGDVTEDLLKVFKAYDNIAPHLHLPLQSGSSKILKRMNRQYNKKMYMDMIELVNKTLDDPAITTDIIVGFPGENQDDFEETIKMAQFAQFAKMHVFSFSLRKGTAAEKMTGKNSAATIKDRAKILTTLGNELQEKYRARFSGKEISVIVENPETQSGMCDRYFDVKLIGKRLAKGDFTRAVLSQNCREATVIE